MSGESHRSRLKLFAKLIISGSLLLLLLGRIDHTKAVAALVALPLGVVLSGLGALGAQAIVLAWRWHRVTVWLIVSVLFGLGLSMVALPGGVLWLFGEYRIRPQN